MLEIVVRDFLIGNAGRARVARAQSSGDRSRNKDKSNGGRRDGTKVGSERTRQDPSSAFNGL